VCFTLCCEFLESLEALALEFCCSRDDRVAGSLQLVVLDHDIACKDGAELSLAPAFVDIDEVFGGDSTSIKVLGVP